MIPSFVLWLFFLTLIYLLLFLVLMIILGFVFPLLAIGWFADGAKKEKKKKLYLSRNRLVCPSHKLELVIALSLTPKQSSVIISTFSRKYMARVEVGNVK